MPDWAIELRADLSAQLALITLLLAAVALELMGILLYLAKADDARRRAAGRGESPCTPA